MRKWIITVVLAAAVSAALAQDTKPAIVEPVPEVAPATSPATQQANGKDAKSDKPLPETLEGAHQRYWKGEYDEAAKVYAKLAKDPASAVAASIGLSDALAAVGKYDEAIKALHAVEQRGRLEADWHVHLSELTFTVGKVEEALEAAHKAHALANDWAPAMLRLGQALESVGKKEQAIAVYRTLDKAIDQAGFTKDARSLVAAGGVLERFSVLTGQKASEQAQHILHNYLQEAYQKADKTYWPAHIAAAALLLNKHKPAEATQELALAHKINPRIPDVSIGRGVILLGQYKFEEAIAQADQALKINPNYPDGHLLRAAVLMMWRKFDQVEPELEKLFKINPNHLDGLATKAALHIRLLEEDKAKGCIDRVVKINPHYGQLYETIGDWLSTARQFEEAETYYRKAIEVAPELAGPVTGLGRVYMQTGREKLAKETLDRAFAIDDFRGDVLNYLKLLEQLEKYTVRETEHFILKVDPKTDEVLLDWLADVAEQIHADITRDYEYSPPAGQKTLVEVFPNQSGFSVRISGRGWIPTVGACTGWVIAMPAPDPERGGFGSFNWAVVLRHEYTHAMTLAMTKNRIPHWFTEACAVREQPDRRNFQAVALLVDAVRNAKLFPIKELDWGFQRPDRSRGPAARSMAYAQSEWIFEYIEEKKGRPTIIKMLKAFGDGWTQQRVFKDLLETDEARFDKDFAAWAKEQVKGWGFDPEPTPDLAKATKAAKDKPESAEAQAELALALYRSRRVGPALEAARKALAIDPRNKRGLLVAAAVLETQKKYDDAIEMALILEKADPKSAPAAKVLAQCYTAKRDWARAIAALESYVKRLPLDPYGYEELAKRYMQMGQAEKALPHLAEMHRRTMKDPKYARQAADIYRGMGETEKSLEFYEQVIQINPYDSGAYKAMASLYLRAKDNPRAIRSMRSACLLEPASSENWAKMAMVYYRAGQADNSAEHMSAAREAANKSIEIDPKGQAVEILQMIDQAGRP